MIRCRVDVTEGEVEAATQFLEEQLGSDTSPLSPHHADQGYQRTATTHHASSTDHSSSAKEAFGANTATKSITRAKSHQALNRDPTEYLEEKVGESKPSMTSPNPFK